MHVKTCRKKACKDMQKRKKTYKTEFEYAKVIVIIINLHNQEKSII